MSFKGIRANLVYDVAAWLASLFRQCTINSCYWSKLLHRRYNRATFNVPSCFNFRASNFVHGSAESDAYRFSCVSGGLRLSSHPLLYSYLSSCEP